MLKQPCEMMTVAEMAELVGSKLGENIQPACVRYLIRQGLIPQEMLLRNAREWRISKEAISIFEKRFSSIRTMRPVGAVGVRLENESGELRIRPKARYPWEKWTDGSEWIAKPGSEFFVSPTSFRTMLYMRAAGYGLGVQTALNRDDLSVRFRFYERGQIHLVSRECPAETGE